MEGEKKLHTKNTFDIGTYKYVNSGTYTSRFVTLPTDAMAIRDVWKGNVMIREAKHNDINLLCSGEFLIKGNKLWLSEVPETIVINYDKIVTDDDGLPMVLETHVNALAWYVIYHFDYAEYRKGNLNRSIMIDSKAEKDRAFRQARGADNMTDWKETKVINENLMRIYDPGNFKSVMFGNTNSDFQGTEQSL